MEVLREGYRIPFVKTPQLSKDPVLLDSYPLSSPKRKALALEINNLISKGAVEPAPPAPLFYSRMFVVLKASGAWHLIMDLSTFNKCVMGTKFWIKMVQSVMASVRKGDWMVSLDLKDAYLQVSIHLKSRQFLDFSTSRGTFQFKVLCFGLTTSLQVFTQVMAPVSVMLHSLGIRMLRYLDDWLIQASSREFCIWARDQVMHLCSELGIILNLTKSQLDPTQIVTYLGMVINAWTLRVSPMEKRVLTLVSLVEEFLSSSMSQPAGF